MATPAFRALKNKYPDSYAAVMTPERTREVFQNNPFIDDIITFDERDNGRSLFAKIKLILTLKKKKFDTVFLIHRSWTRAFLCFLAEIKTRVGYNRSKNFLLLTNRIDPPAENIHRQDYYLGLFEKYGIPVTDKSGEVFITADEQKKYADFFGETRKRNAFIVGLNPSANWDLKRWPAENFSKLADTLVKETNCGIVLIGEEKERKLIEEVKSGIRMKPYDLCGKTTLRDLAAIISGCDIFISNDSGPAHLAAAMGINTLVLFGPTAKELTGPRGQAVKIINSSVGCKIPCYKTNCADNLCMKKITVEEVLAETKKILAAKKSPQQ
jgi:lipopolysaccharide heptosyltransferase II